MSRLLKSKQKNIEYPPVYLRDVMREFFRSIRRYKFSFFITLVCICAVATTDIFVPLFYRKFFDIVAGSARTNETSALLITVIIEIGLFHVANWLGYRIATVANAYFQTKVIADLKQRAFEYLIGHSYSFFVNNFTGSLVQRVNRFGRAFERLADRVVWNVLPLFVSVTGIIVVLFTVKPMIALVMLVWIIIFLLFNYFFSQWKFKYDVDLAALDSRSTAVLSDAITNHTTIQLFTGAPVETERFREVTDEQGKQTRFVWNLDGLIEAGQALLMIAIEFLLFYFAIKYWEMGVVTVGVFVLIQAYLIGLGGRLWDLTRVVRDIYQNYADAKEMVEILKLAHGITDSPRATEIRVVRGEVRLDHLSFSFGTSQTVLHDLLLTIAPAEKIALIGPSGAGKSTIVKLLLRFYDPTQGAILIDGVDIRTITQKSLRENVSMVPQDPLLFHRTLLENIRYGKRKATDAEVFEAGRLAHCDEFIKNFPAGYETFVGERGVKLSGGERQRVAIARAILKNAPILILDEATSSLDSHSESLIQDALEVLMKNKTVIVIAHRLSTIRKMDRIVVLQNGKIIEEGSHDELLTQEAGLYKKLWSLQAGGFIHEE